MRGENGVVGPLRGYSQCGSADGAGRREADRIDREGGGDGENAQEELQAVCAASEADREFVGAAKNLEAEEVSGDSRAVGAVGGGVEEVLHFGQQLPRPELSVSACYGLEYCVSVQKGAE